MAIPYNRRTHFCGDLRGSDVGKNVLLVGWVNNYRDHGGMVFIDVRDYTGITQIKFNPETDPKAHEIARHLRMEDVIAVRGDVASRGENVNPKVATGEIELNGREVELLAKSDPVPFEIAPSEEKKRELPHEDLRLQYRYLDLRRPEVQQVFRLRHRIAKAIRDYFDANGFIEIETPFLTKSTPEGARDYLVPSRVHPGSFYALPQSPQLFKQLFMVGGFDRYAQIVRCFRDEDLRGDRQPEFTQLDMEMSFVQADDVMSMVEGSVRDIFKKGIGVNIALPLPRMSYAEAMNRYGIDKPDTRFGLELQDITDIVRNVDFSIFRDAIAKGGLVKCVVASGEALTRKVTDGLTEEIKGIGGGGLPLTKVIAGANGPEFSTGIAKFIQPVFSALTQKVGAKAGDTIFYMPGGFHSVCKYLHHVRTRLAEILKLVPADRWNVLWVHEFPLLQWNPEEKRWDSMHHPFTAPIDDDLPLLDSSEHDVIDRIRAKAYDLVLNGTEMAGGSIRIHRCDVQAKVFRLLGISDEEANVKFQFLMDALRYGAPPHGGIAFGLDRWVMLLGKQESLRDVIAYPKTGNAVCQLTKAPTPVSEKQLRELHLDVRTH